MQDEFINKPFYPDMFYWRDSNKKDTKKACRILNELSKEQIWAVERYASSRYNEGDSNGYETGSGECGEL